MIPIPASGLCCDYGDRKRVDGKIVGPMSDTFTPRWLYYSMSPRRLNKCGCGMGKKGTQVQGEVFCVRATAGNARARGRQRQQMRNSRFGNAIPRMPGNLNSGAAAPPKPKTKLLFSSSSSFSSAESCLKFREIKANLARAQPRPNPDAKGI